MLTAVFRFNAKFNVLNLVIGESRPEQCMLSKLSQTESVSDKYSASAPRSVGLQAVSARGTRELLATIAI